MRTLYSDAKNWTNSNYKESFKNLANDGYKYDSIDFENWFFFKMQAWQSAVLCRVIAHKIIAETEKAYKVSIVNEYGSLYEMWFPKKAIIRI